MFHRMRMWAAGLAAPIGTVAAVLVVALPPSPGLAATGSKVYTANVPVSCVLAPGLLDSVGTVNLTLQGTAPTAVSPGDQVALSNITATMSIPAAWATAFSSLGATTTAGAVTHFEIDSDGTTPSSINTATALPGNQLPFGPAAVTSGKALSIQVPNSGGFSLAPVSVTGAAGTTETLSLDPAPGYSQSGAIYSAISNQGIAATATGNDASGNTVVGPLGIYCNAPSTPAVLGAIPIVAAATSTTTATSTVSTATTPATTTASSTTQAASPTSSSTTTASSTTHATPTSSSTTTASATTTGTTRTTSSATSTATSSNTTTASATTSSTTRTSTSASTSTTSTPAPHMTVKFSNWSLGGAVVDRALGQTITIPSGATFNGSADLTAGTLGGSINVPAFTTNLKVMGMSTTVGLSLTPTGPVTGTVTPDAKVAGNLDLAITAKVNLGINRITILGMTLQPGCTTTSPVTFGLANSLPALALTTGASFSGTTTLPSVQCHGLLGGLLSPILTALLSGPNNAYTLTLGPAA